MSFLLTESLSGCLDPFSHAKESASFCNPMAAMSFDHYFDGKVKQSRRSRNSDDWYEIVEEALYAAEVASCLNRQQLENSLMKALPMIPEDDAVDSSSQGSEPDSTSRSSSVTAGLFHLKTADSSRSNISWKADVQEHVAEVPNDDPVSRRPSSLYDPDFESPLSAESDELDAWVGEVCSTGRNSMSSLRSKPYTRQSSYTDSATSERRVSTGSSVVVRRSKSTSSSVYSTDTLGTSISPGSSAKSSCTHSRGPSANSVVAPRKVRSEDSGRISFFDFSDSEEEKRKEVTAARRESSASSYVKQLRQKALSLRLATSKLARTRVRSMSLPSRDGPALSTWLFRRSSVHVDRISTSSTDYLEDLELDNELMLGAAASAKAKRVLGL